MAAMRWILSIALVLTVTGCQDHTTPAATGGSSQGEGWSVQFCKDEIEAPTVELDVGVDANSREDWLTWNTGQAAKQLVPEKYLHVNEIWVEGKAMPAENDVVFCLKYDGVAKRHYDFDDTEDHKVDKNRNEGECKC
jgi:hypothetical protein